MKTISKKGYVVIASILIISMLAGLSIFGIFSNASRNSKLTTTKGNDDYASVERDTSISVDSNGILQINRKTREQEIPMGKENSWTLMLYMTGTNLESQYGNATNDINEILRSRFNTDNADNVNIIIQTGGCLNWHSHNIANDKIQRYIVDESTKELKHLEDVQQASMGSPETLYNFLDWGVSNYPAEHMGVIMWDHGAGVSGGVCADPLYDNDAITVHELEYAFAKINKKMTSKFDLIGFDTCLAGSLEYANLLAPYGKYMVASAELEPGDGWYYTGFISELYKNPDISALDIGKMVCNDYAIYYESPTQQVDLTIALYDLSKVDRVCVEANYLLKFFYDTLRNDISKYWELTGMQKGRIRYNRDNVDIGSLLDYLETTTQFNYNTTYFRQALNDFIVDYRVSKYYGERKAIGLSLYYPDSIIYMPKLNNYRNVCFSPYWLKYIELMTMRNITENVSNFNETKWESSPYFFENNFNFINYDNYEMDDNTGVYQKLVSNSDYLSSGFPGNWQSIYSVSSIYQGGYLPPHLMRNVDTTYTNNTISAQINDDKALKDIYAVYGSVFTEVDNNLVCLGSNNDATYDSNTGKITSTFNGEWFMLPDGQLLTTYIISSTDDETVYAFPVLINNTEVTIRIKESNVNGKSTYTTLGVWDSNNDKEQAPRGYLPLEVGTTITPIYDVFDTEADEYESEFGEEYTITSDFDFLFGQLEDGKYSFAYQLEKLNGISSYTELTEFNVRNSAVTINK